MEDVHSPEWMQYYEEEKEKLFQLLDDFVVEPERPFQSGKAVRTKNVMEKVEQPDEEMRKFINLHKQRIIQKLLKVRGKLYIEHEQILNAEKRSLIAAADLELKAKLETLRADCEKQMKEQTLKNYSILFQALLNPDSVKTPIPPEALQDEALKQNVIKTVNEVNFLADEYYRRKLQRGMAAIETGLNEIKKEQKQQQDQLQRKAIHDENTLNRSSSSSSSSSRLIPNPSQNNILQIEIMKLMEQRKKQFQNQVSNPQFISKLNPQNAKNIRALEKIIDENMKLTAKVCILRQMKQTVK